LITIVIPVKGEETPGAAFFARAAGHDVVVAADASTGPAVLDAFRATGASIVVGTGPRGLRLVDAARGARGDVLVFLHADTLLPAAWDDRVREAIDGGAVAGAFRLAFDGGGLRMAWVAAWANFRTRFTRIPYGDQAPFVRRDVYERLGGHAPWPLLEDVELYERLRKEGRIAILPDAVRTSPRRYLERGVARTVLTNWRTLIRYRRGVNVEELARDYRKS